MQDIKGKEITVWFSSGVASAIATLEIIKKYSSNNQIKVVNNPIKEEHEDNLRFKSDIEKLIGTKIINCENLEIGHNSAEKIWIDRKYMAGINGAPCTMLLKKGARYQFEKTNKIYFHVLGFTVEEWKRQKRFNESERENTIPILVSKLITKNDCNKILNAQNIKRPKIYDLGYNNANCIGCPKAQSAKYWNITRKEFPEVFKKRMELSRELGVKLVKIKNKRMFLDELDPNILTGEIKEFECLIFCNKD